MSDHHAFEGDQGDQVDPGIVGGEKPAPLSISATETTTTSCGRFDTAATKDGISTTPTSPCIRAAGIASHVETETTRQGPPGPPSPPRFEHLDRFIARLHQKLELGARQYGSASFERPLVELITEIEDELVDIAGWGWIAWSRLEALRALVARAEQLGGHRG